MSTYNGEYGGRVVRRFQGEGGKPYIVGAELSAEEVSNWPIGNRKALHSTHKVEWYGPPRDVEIKQESKPSKKVVDIIETKAVKTSSRTNRTPRKGN